MLSARYGFVLAYAPDVPVAGGGAKSSSTRSSSLPYEKPWCDATLAAAEEASDDEGTLLADDLRARFCASIDGRRQVRMGEEVELAIDNQHLHFFDPETGTVLGDRTPAGT